MKRQYSGKKLVIVIFFVMLTVAVLCLTVCGGYALYNSMQDMMTYNRVALDLYLNDLVHVMGDMQNFNEDVFANDLDFTALSRENPVCFGGAAHAGGIQSLPYHPKPDAGNHGHPAV